MPFCPGCGCEVIESAEVCPKCGTRVGKEKKTAYPRLPNGDLVTGEKSVAIAVILGFLIPGTGAMYGGKIGLGIVILILSYALIIVAIGIIPWIYGIWLGYDLCKKNNLLWYEYLDENR